MERIIKTIQIIIDLIMGLGCISVSVEALNKSYYCYTDWYAYMAWFLVGIIMFNILCEYVRRVIKNY